MSQKRKTSSKYPPTEGETEDTTVIVEPTSAVQKRTRTTRGSSKNVSEPLQDAVDGTNNNNEGDGPAAVAPAIAIDDGVIIPPSSVPTVVVTTATAAVATDTNTMVKTEKELGNNDVNAVEEDNINDDDMDDDAVVIPVPRSSKKKSGILTLNMPSHLNPTNPDHFDHFLFYLLVVRAESDNPAQNICKEEYPLLYAWIQHVKKEYKLHVNSTPNCQLTAQQVKVLEYLHVPLTSRGDDHWNRYYEFLVSYKQRHGHVLVPRLCEIPGLGDWVTDQRRQYKNKQQGQASQMTTARQELLEDLDFVWHVRNRPEWEVRYSELLEYKAEYGDCRVPQHYKPNRSLGKWVAKQREQFKLKLKGQHSFLTPYREEKLNQAGFSWHVRNSLDNEVQNVMDEMIHNNRSALAATSTSAVATATATAIASSNDYTGEDKMTTGLVTNTTTTTTTLEQHVDDAVKMEQEIDIRTDPQHDEMNVPGSNSMAAV